MKNSTQKPIKMLLDNLSEVYTRSMESWLQDSSTEFYSIHNE